MAKKAAKTKPSAATAKAAGKSPAKAARSATGKATASGKTAAGKAPPPKQPQAAAAGKAPPPKQPQAAAAGKAAPQGQPQASKPTRTASGKTAVGKVAPQGQPQAAAGSYLGLARKWRPAVFAELVGQDAVASSLANSIESGKIVHGHLLAGPRGVGKTTSARIFARCLNCAKGPTATPCGECSHCRDIPAGNDMDVIEIDAASNTGVDKMRELLERVVLSPFGSRFKVYIIDEVHMLSTSSFNALLKTLEEPPAHVIFIFATTELEKIPETVRSRCIVHSFRRLSIEDIVRRLDEVARGEGIEFEAAAGAEVFGLIARAVDGGMRDALVALDQLIAMTGGKLEVEAAQQLLGLSGREALADAVGWVASGDAASLMTLVEDLVSRGRSLERFVKDMLAYLHDIMVLQAVPGREVGSLSGEALERAQSLAEEFSQAAVFNMLNQFFELEERLKRSGQGRLLLEFALLRMATIKPLVPIEEIMNRLRALPDTPSVAPGAAPDVSPQNAASGGVPGGAASTRGTGGTHGGERGGAGGGAQARSAKLDEPASSGPARAEAAHTESPRAKAGSRALAESGTAYGSRMTALPEGAAATMVMNDGDAVPEQAGSSEMVVAVAPEAPSVAPAAPAPQEATKAGNASEVSGPNDILGGITDGELLARVEDCISEKHRYLRRYLRLAVALRIEGETLRIEWARDDRVGSRMIGKPDNLRALEQSLEQLCGRPIKVRTSFSNDEEATPLNQPRGNPAQSQTRQAPGADQAPGVDQAGAFNDSAPAGSMDAYESEQEPTFDPPEAYQNDGAPVHIPTTATAIAEPFDYGLGGRRGASGATRGAEPASGEQSVEIMKSDPEFARRARMVRDFFDGKFVDGQGRPIPAS